MKNGRLTALRKQWPKLVPTPAPSHDDNSLHACHLRLVRELEARGEKILRPPTMKTLWTDHKPDIYNKKAKSEEDLNIGHGIIEKDGTVTILGEFLSWYAGPFQMDEVGLIDAHAFYESENAWKHISKVKA